MTTMPTNFSVSCLKSNFYATAQNNLVASKSLTNKFSFCLTMNNKSKYGNHVCCIDILRDYHISSALLNMSYWEAICQPHNLQWFILL